MLIGSWFEWVLEARIYELEKKLKRAQEINFLLNILEQKENLRLRRFQDMTEMLGDLRYIWTKLQPLPRSLT